MTGHDPEEMLCELDSLLFSLVGAFDVAARAADHILAIGTRGSACGWQNMRNRGNHPVWQPGLEAHARDLFDYARAWTGMQRAFGVLRWLRNTVHHQALDLIVHDGSYLGRPAVDRFHLSRGIPMRC